MLLVLLTICFLKAFFAYSSQLEPIISCYLQKDKPPVDYLELQLCTHYNFIGSCTIDEHYRIVLPNSSIISAIKSRLQLEQPGPKLLITLTPENTRMSYLVKSEELRKALIADVRQYLLENNVDGFDIDWEFPVWSPDALPTDKKGLAILIKELRESFEEAKVGLLLSVAVAAPYTIVDKAYDVDAFNRYLNYVQIMNYDFHMYSKREPCTGLNAPLFRKLYEFGFLGRMNSDYSTRHWLKKGLWTNKTVFGIPTYGRGYTLLSNFLHFIYAPAVGNAAIGAVYPFAKVCNLTETDGYKYVFDRKTRSAYIYGGNRQWLGLEDPITMFSKASYMKVHYLAGIMIYDLASDDYKGDCKHGTYPLIKAAKAAVYSNRTMKEKDFESNRTKNNDDDSESNRT